MRRWAAISTVAGALKRNVCIRLQQTPIFPNMYILLIGRPGVGKSRPVRVGGELLRRTAAHVAPAMTTKESFLLRLGKDSKDDKQPGWLDAELNHPLAKQDDLGVYLSSTVTIMSEEFSNFVQEGDTLFMDALTELYDCPKVFEKHTKASGDDKLSNVAVNLIGGTTADALTRVLPDAAFKQGFASRLNLIYSDDSDRKSLFGGEPEIYHRTLKALEEDLVKISTLRGEFKFLPDVAQALDKWYLDGMEPVPQHPRLVTYNERRHIHLVKLMMIVSAARRDDMLITMDDLQAATAYLLEAEHLMADALNKMGTSRESSQYEDAVAFMTKYFKINQRPMAEMEFRAYLVRKFPAREIRGVVEELLQAGWIKSVGGSEGARLFMPGAKE